MKNSAIANLKKAHQAKAITQDTYSLEKYLAKFEGEGNAPKGKAHMALVGIETKYIPTFDRNSPQWNGQAAGNGHRTRFILEDGSTVGSFSSASHALFVFFAELMGFDGTESYLRVEVSGKIVVEVSKIALDATRTTYNFDVIEEGSELNGFSNYLPTANEVLGLAAPTTFTEDKLLLNAEYEDVPAEDAPIEGEIVEDAKAKKK